MSLSGGRAWNGKVFSLERVPGEPDLLTVKALKLIESADVVLHDDLVSSEILELIPATAHVHNVGGETLRQKEHAATRDQCTLITFASFGLRVVRLKGGDPSIFGRTAAKKWTPSEKHGVEFKVGVRHDFGTRICCRGPSLAYAPRQIIRSDSALQSSCESRPSGGLGGLRCIGSDPCGLHAWVSLSRNRRSS